MDVLISFMSNHIRKILGIIIILGLIVNGFVFYKGYELYQQHNKLIKTQKVIMDVLPIVVNRLMKLDNVVRQIGKFK